MYPYFVLRAWCLMHGARGSCYMINNRPDRAQAGIIHSDSGSGIAHLAEVNIHSDRRKYNLRRDGKSYSLTGIQKVRGG